MIFAKSEFGEFKCDRIIVGAVSSEPISADSVSADPRCVVERVPMDLHAVQSPLPGSVARWNGKVWYVWKSSSWLAHCIVSIELRRAKLVDCCKGDIVTLSRGEGCDDEDVEESVVQGVKMIRRHDSTEIVRSLNSEIPISRYEFKLEGAPILDERNIVRYDGKDYKVSSVKNAGNPMELTTVVSQISPLARAVL